MTMPTRRIARFAAASALIAATTGTAQGEDRKLVIGAQSVVPIEFHRADGKKDLSCRVFFTLKNNTGRALRRARFWVVAANGKRESFGLSDRKTRNREMFDRTPCSAVKGKLKLERALCVWDSAEKPVDCRDQTLVQVN